MVLLDTPTWKYKETYLLYRFGEQEYLKKNKIDLRSIYSDWCWVRIPPELVTDEVFCDIWNKQKNFKKIINSYSSFHLWDSKGETFDVWNLFGISTPRYTVVNSVDDVIEFNRKFPNCILRLNNYTMSADIKLINNENMILPNYEALKKMKNSLGRNRSHTKIIAVEFIGERYNGPQNYIRSYVVNNKVILSYINPTVMKNGHLDPLGYDMEAFIVDNNNLNVSENIQRQLIKSVSIFNLQTAAVDWLYHDNNCYILELAPYFGMGLREFPFHYSWEEYMKKNIKFLPDNLQARLNFYEFWDLYYTELFSYIKNQN